MHTLEKRIRLLLTKYEQNQISATELEELNGYILDKHYEEIINRHLDNRLDHVTEDEGLAIDSDRIYQRILLHPLYKQSLTQRRKHTKKRAYYTGLAAVIALAILCAASLFYFGTKDSAKDLPIAEAENEIRPGTNKAILSTAEGKEIHLSEGHSLVIMKEGRANYEDGTIVSAQEESPVGSVQSFCQLKTPRGGQYRVELEDGTRVYLNAASVLKYPAHFDQDNRQVELLGEAYFEVASDKHRPFYVSSKGQRVEVLGTKFNINAYNEENTITTTLMEGAVRVNSLTSNQGKHLRPGQQTVYTLVKDDLKVKEANIDAVSAWYRGYFDFTDQTIRSAMQQIARWYDVEVVFQTGVSDRLLEGDVSRYDRVEDVLDVLSAIGAADFQIEGRKIMVKKNK